MKIDVVLTGPRSQRWLRFVVGGGINTAFTSLFYLGMHVFVSYQIAYLAA